MIVKAIYKTIRSIVFTVTLLIVGLYVLAYTLVSIPAFTNKVSKVASAELSNFLGGNIEIGSIDIYPFNEVEINDVEVFDPEGNVCLEIDKIGAGISIWKLIFQQHMVLTFGEIIGLKAYITQNEEGQPLNIDFILKAFAPQNDKKEKKPFNITLRNVVLRKSSVSFKRPWIKDKKIGDLDFGDLEINDLAADISFPKISDKEIEIDLRRLSLAFVNGPKIEKIAFKGEISPNNINIDNFILSFPASQIKIPEINLSADPSGSFISPLKQEQHLLKITDSYITPSDFSCFFHPLNKFTERLSLQTGIKGNLSAFDIEDFYFGNADVLTCSFSGHAEDAEGFKSLAADIKDFNLSVSSEVAQRIIPSIQNIPPEVVRIIENLGNLKIGGNFAGNLSDKTIEGNFDCISNAFSIYTEGTFKKETPEGWNVNGEINIENLRLQNLVPSIPITFINCNIIAEGKILKNNPQGMVSLVIDDFEYKGKRFDGLSLNINKEDDIFEGDMLVHNDMAWLEAKFGGNIDSEEKNMRLDMDLSRLDLSQIFDLKKYNDYLISGYINLDGKLSGSSQLEGELSLNNFSFEAPDQSKSLKLKQLQLNASTTDSIQAIQLKSDWIEAEIDGRCKWEKLPNQLKMLAHSVFPALIKDQPSINEGVTSDLEFDILIKKNNSIPEFFNLPIRLLVPMTIAGNISGSSNSASLNLNLPYLQQGKDKLIYDTKLLADIDGDSGILNLLFQTNVPVKRGDLGLNINLTAQEDNINTDIHWINSENADFRGRLILDTQLIANDLARIPEIILQIKPSVQHLGSADWNIRHAKITYSDNCIAIDGLKLWHDDQFVEISGVASPEYADAVTINLQDIDVDYIFDMLQINYVTFGGVATGEIMGRALLSGNPIAETESLVIKDFKYNGASLGTCVASSRWNNEQKEIEIGAEISYLDREIVNGRGGIWLGKDSLSFDLKADKVPVDFIQPFMAVFSSHVGGYATGDVKLFGTFHDIDMTGKIFADSVAVRLDYTNTVYNGSDSVILSPGKIDIPHFILHDKFGNTALLTGELTHRYFHDPSFTFRLSDADNFLCYDTNSDINPDWYGTLFGTGSALLKGVPGTVDISADMTVSGNSNFTFVLNDTQYARDYQFLTFSDRRAEEARQNQSPTTQDIKEMLRQRIKQEDGSPSRFGIDIMATVTPQALFTLVMDPAAGDKITARGRGALQVKYESDNDEMTMYGKYEISEGNYNFSLQDIILRDFKIKEGSFIAFNGNPLAADLDIDATYRVNTNLSDLDKSFSTDRDLNRTNVPVDAVLSVTGNMTSPDITFDIELPTLTQDVERKVKSIISTDDMMNRQIIYLLALNRFYTPEYMGNSGNGGELAGIASSTISSQLSNILGQLTDKFSVAPSFRSDKGDFSDIEVDVALSSRLLNNRLLINGNFGYRDRSNSSTTFIGDFDVEYLLSKNGNLRLKAYNHFNDQNYYLREALTTQGLGIVYRKDFDDWGKFLKRKKKAASAEVSEF